MTEKNKGKKPRMTGSCGDAFECRNKYHKDKYTAEWTWHNDMHGEGGRHRCKPSGVIRGIFMKIINTYLKKKDAVDGIYICICNVYTHSSCAKKSQVIQKIRSRRNRFPMDRNSTRCPSLHTH